MIRIFINILIHIKENWPNQIVAKILVTGSAGFIGYHLTNALIREGHEVIGLDSINSYYDIQLKFDRLNDLGIEKEDISYNKLVN